MNNENIITSEVSNTDLYSKIPPNANLVNITAGSNITNLVDLAVVDVSNTSVLQESRDSEVFIQTEMHRETTSITTSSGSHGPILGTSSLTSSHQIFVFDTL